MTSDDTKPAQLEQVRAIFVGAHRDRIFNFKTPDRTVREDVAETREAPASARPTARVCFGIPQDAPQTVLNQSAQGGLPLLRKSF
ncbi:MAG: hypothetical protein WCH35_04900 [Comamonadaceae bacterium]